MAHTGTRVVVILLLAVWAGILVAPSWLEHDRTREDLAEIDQQLLVQQKAHESLRGEIYRLQSDDRAVEKVARDKFGLCRPGEKIYDFSTGAE